MALVNSFGGNGSWNAVIGISNPANHRNEIKSAILSGVISSMSGLPSLENFDTTGADTSLSSASYALVM